MTMPPSAPLHHPVPPKVTEPVIEDGSWVYVAVGLVLRNFPHAPEVLMAERTGHQHYSGYWEFPGGKVEKGEIPFDALERELYEELAIKTTSAYPWGGPRHFVYPHAKVRLFFYRVTEWEGEPHGAEGQTIRWFPVNALPDELILPANKPLVKLLKAPPLQLITDLEHYSAEIILRRIEEWCDRTTPFSVQIRDKHLPLNERLAWGTQIKSLVESRRADCMIIWNGDADTAYSHGFHGVHTPSNLWQTEAFCWPSNLPDTFWKSAACHTQKDLIDAEKKGFDSATYSPIAPTPTHPDAEILGWTQFHLGAKNTTLLVYGLGGLTPYDMHTALEHGAHGIAICSSAWKTDL